MKKASITLLVLVVLQGALALSSFKSRESLFCDDPILNVDFSSQYYWAHAAREFTERSGKMWGYDPFFMAGYPLDFVFNSALPVQLVAVGFRGVSLGRVIKACFLSSVILVPFVLYLSMRWFGLDRGAALSACALGAVYWWVGENGFFAHMGMISGAFLLAFFTAPLSLLLRWLETRANRSFVLFLFALAFSFIVHKTAFVLVLPVAFVWIALWSPSLHPREWGLLVGAFIFALLANLHWLYPFFKFLPLKVEDPSTTFFQCTDPLRFLKDLWPLPPRQPFYALPIARIIILASGAYGLFILRRERRPVFAAFCLALVFFWLLTYFGSLIESLRHLQPYRYVTAFYYMWLPAAGYGLSGLAVRMSERGRGLAAPLLIAAACLILMVLPSFRHFALVAPLTHELDGDSRALVEWVRNNTDSSARLLMEDVNVWEGQGPAVYGGARLVQLMPVLTGREMIGGPLPNAFIKHHYAGFHDGLLMNRPVGEYSDRELDQLAGTYNLGWAACFTEESKKRMDAWPLARAAADFGRVRVYELERDGSFFLSGSGEVRAGFNRLDLSSLSTSCGKVVLSYHWVEGLQSWPQAELFRAEAGGDPAGFIGIKDPPPELLVRLGR